MDKQWFYQMTMTGCSEKLPKTATAEDIRAHRVQWVKNIVELLKMTRVPVIDAEINDEDVVTIHMGNRDGTEHVCLAYCKWDSYLAMLNDIVRAVMIDVR